MRAGAILQKRAKNNPKIEFIWDTAITKINGEEAVTGLELKNLKTGQTSTFKTMVYL